MEVNFERNTFGKRLKTMLKVDFRRMFTMRLFYIMAGICFAMPVLMLVMTSMFGGDVEAGAESAGMFTNTWQAIGSLSGSGGMTMDMTTMCNINMLYFFGAILVCLFVSEDFKSGYCKNLFTIRAKKGDYVISKTLVSIVSCGLLLIAFMLGAIVGGGIAGLPFDLGSAGVGGLVMCMLTKILLMGLFVAIFLLFSVIAKQKTWLSMVISFCVDMLLFMMVPALTPLDATIVNVVVCLIAALIFDVVLGMISTTVLSKTSLV